MKNRKYCSIECRQTLRHHLNLRTGLLKALNTRYGSFYFSDKMIFLDILPYNSKEIYSFIYHRTPEFDPVKDFIRAHDILAKKWWEEQNRTQKNYRANQLVFDDARLNNSPQKSLQPKELRLPSVNSKTLLYLQLGQTDLKSKELEIIIKTAFRKQAKAHHPDLGGDAQTFRRIHDAYEQLINWSHSPTFFRRRGFIDRWFYNGENNKWVQPLPLKKRT